MHVLLCRQKQQEAMSASVPQRNRRNISSLTWKSPRATRKRTTTTMRKKSAHPTTTNRPPAPQTPTRQQRAIPAALGTLGRALLNGSPRARPRNPPQGEFGAADALPPQAAGERCSPRGPGRLRPERSLPAARAVPPAAACPHVWSCPHPSTATPRGQRRPCPASMSHCPLREEHPPSDPFPRFVLLPPAATGRPEPGPLPRHSGYSTEPLDTCLGRAQVQGRVTSSR